MRRIRREVEDLNGIRGLENPFGARAHWSLFLIFFFKASNISKKT
jgi:hypothetical protein